MKRTMNQNNIKCVSVQSRSSHVYRVGHDGVISIDRFTTQEGRHSFAIKKSGRIYEVYDAIEACFDDDEDMED